LGAVTFAHPLTPRPDVSKLEDAPDILLESTEPIAPLVVPRQVPAKPRVAAPPAREPAAAAEQPNEPLLAPELSEQQVSDAKAAIDQSLSVAERNIGLAGSKTLNAAQQDLVSKIRGFVDSAREAMKNSDWQRAQIQAKKAEVLSQEFAPKQ